LFLNEGLHHILPIRYAVCDNPRASCVLSSIRAQWPSAVGV
jgi:hypothetical protein